MLFTFKFMICFASVLFNNYKRTLLMTYVCITLVMICFCCVFFFLELSNTGKQQQRGKVLVGCQCLHITCFICLYFFFYLRYVSVFKSSWMSLSTLNSPVDEKNNKMFPLNFTERYRFAQKFWILIHTCTKNYPVTKAVD